MGNSKADADNSSSGLRGGMGSCRHMAVDRRCSNRFIISSRCSSNRSSSSSNMFIDSSNRISSNTFGNGSSNYSFTIPLTHHPNGESGPFDCGSSATGWYQEESPPPPNSPMGSVYQCKRCGRLGLMAEICTTPQRFEDTCNSCDQYGHRHYNYARVSSHLIVDGVGAVAPQLVGAGGGAGAVEHQQARPQQQQRPPHSMGAGGGAGAVEHQRARPQQQQRPPHSTGAGVGAGAEETQQQRQSPQ